MKIYRLCALKDTLFVPVTISRFKQQQQQASYGILQWLFVVAVSCLRELCWLLAPQLLLWSHSVVGDHHAKSNVWRIRRGRLNLIFIVFGFAFVCVFFYFCRKWMFSFECARCDCVRPSALVLSHFRQLKSNYYGRKIKSQEIEKKRKTQK